MTIKNALLGSLLLLGSLAQAQKPAIDLAAIDAWKHLSVPSLSPNGQWASYELKPNDGDPDLWLYHQRDGAERTFARSSKAAFSLDGRYLLFHTHPHQDTLKAMRRQKVKKDKLPKDTLSILSLNDGSLVQMPRLKRYLLPEKWEGWAAIHLLPVPRDTSLPDSIKVKKESDENGSLLLIRNLRTGQQDSLPYVKDFIAAEEGPRFLVHSTGKDTTFQEGIYLYDCPTGQLRPLLQGKGHYGKMALSNKGLQAAFLALADTVQHQAVPYRLWHWQDGQPTAKVIADSSSYRSAAFLPKGWMLGEHYELDFAEDGSKLFFGIAPPPVLKDTTLIEEDIVEVEVWAYTDSRLYTQEEALLDKTRKKAYDCVYHTGSGRIVRLGSEDLPEIMFGNEGKADFALGLDNRAYLSATSWEGFPERKDVYLIELATGNRTRIAEKVAGSPKLSPAGKYAYWYSYPDSVWMTFSVEKRELHQLAKDAKVPFWDELNDLPNHPRPHGIAGWTTDDDFIMLYARYDIWLVDPLENLASNNLTKGRAQKQRYRYIQLDPEQRSIEEVKAMLLHTFNEQSKASGYVWFDIHTGVKDQVQEGPYEYSSQVQKAKYANHFLFDRQSFAEYPDLLLSTDNLKTFKRISNANPQQDSYRWGTIEPYQWTGANGELMEGLLIKPENFDPGRKYPMMTYFYERYSDRLHRHWAPRYPRSFINFPYYASRGYVIFIPDIHYRVGYPGQSAFHAVTTGVASLLDKGFVDRERLGVQGHSWGGYQSAYLITQTDLFKCAESGAPVVNMTSAYGGIRWSSGLSRMFQYERTQSRIGGTLWEKPLRYIENSPIFFADKINTPVLILHNDEDGAVPWYQGIEFFVALRRLGKPAWLLNYNGEPHGVKKEHYRRDFMQRMQQFFDHYLLDEPMPEWMEAGVPPLLKGK